MSYVVNKLITPVDQNWFYLQSFLPDPQINFSVGPKLSKDPFTFFSGFEVTVITLNEESWRAKVADELMNSLAFFFICDDHHGPIDET